MKITSNPDLKLNNPTELFGDWTKNLDKLRELY